MKVTSYSIFGYSGRNGNYWAYIPSLLRLHSLLFPDYKLVLYHDESLHHMAYGRVLQRLNQDGRIDIHDMGKNEMLCKSMLWRCKAIWDYPEAQAVFFRDLDSCPTYRERCANESFINSPYSVHGINDNKAHSVPLMGGLWGCKPKKYMELTKHVSWGLFISLQKGKDFTIHGSDQLFLRDEVLGHIEGKILVHKEIPFINFPEIDEGVRSKDKEFMPYMGAAGYKRACAIDYCNEKDTEFLSYLKLVEKEFGIEAKTHKYIKLDD